MNCLFLFSKKVINTLSSAYNILFLIEKQKGETMAEEKEKVM